MVSPSKCSTSIFSFPVLEDDQNSTKKDDSIIQSVSDFSEALQNAISNSDKQFDPESFSKFFNSVNPKKPQQSQTPEFRSKYSQLYRTIESKALISNQATSSTTPFTVKDYQIDPCHRNQISSSSFQKLNLEKQSPHGQISSFQPAEKSLEGSNLNLVNNTKINTPAREDLRSDRLQSILSKYLNQQASTGKIEPCPALNRPKDLHSKLQEQSCTSTIHPLLKEPVSRYLKNQRLCRSLGGSIDLERSGTKSPFELISKDQLNEKINREVLPSKNKAMYSSLTITPSASNTVKDHNLNGNFAFAIDKKRKPLLRLSSGSFQAVEEGSNSKLMQESTGLSAPVATNMRADLFLTQPQSLISPKDSFLLAKDRPGMVGFTFESAQISKDYKGEPMKVLKSLSNQLAIIDSKTQVNKTTLPYDSFGRPTQVQTANRPNVSLQFSYPEPLVDLQTGYSRQALHQTPDSVINRYVSPKYDVFYWPQKNKELKETVVKIPKKPSDYPQDLSKKEPPQLSRSFQSSLTPVKTVTIDFHSKLAEKKSICEPTEAEMRSKVEDYLRQMSEKTKNLSSITIARPTPAVDGYSSTSFHPNRQNNPTVQGDSSLQIHNPVILNEVKVLEKESMNKKSSRSVTFDLEKTEAAKDLGSSTSQTGGIRSILKKKTPSNHSFSKYLEMEKSSNQIPIYRTQQSSDHNLSSSKRDRFQAPELRSSYFQRDLITSRAVDRNIRIGSSQVLRTPISSGYLGYPGPIPATESRSENIMMHAERKAGPYDHKKLLSSQEKPNQSFAFLSSQESANVKTYFQSPFQLTLKNRRPASQGQSGITSDIRLPEGGFPVFIEPSKIPHGSESRI